MSNINSNNNNINNNSNNNMLSLSLAQGKVFRNQQQTRVLTNTDVVTGNNARAQKKNKVRNQKNGKMVTCETMANANIEPFSQQNSLNNNNNNNNNNYTPLSKNDIAADDKRIKITNDIENAQTKAMISSYSQVSNNLNKFQKGVTNEANAYNNINKIPELLNQNYTTADGQSIRVNNAGVINTLVPNNLQQNTTSGINISTSIQKSPSDLNYIPVKNIPAGLTSGLDSGLYGETSSTTINMPSGISGYNLEGENVFVIYPYPNSVAAINQNISYYGAYTSVSGLITDNVISPNTTLICIQRAIDKGYTGCGMTSYSGGLGNSMIGNINSYSNYAYMLKSVSPATTGLTFPQGYSSLTLGADGVLYAGYAGSGGNSLFRSKLTPTFNSSLNPTYGGTINNLVASYAYNQGYWNNLASFATNSDLNGQPYGTYNTLYQYDVEIPNTGYYTQTSYNNESEEITNEIPYTYYTTQTETQYAAPNTGYGNFTYINYYCGNNTAPNTPINVGGQNAGVGYNLTCAELYNQYPSFTLTLSDTGVLTISNTNSNTSPPSVTFNMSFGYPSQVTLTNGQVVTLNMPRPDWVSESINNGRNLTSSSMNTQSINNGQWISSPNGFCRLILTGDTLELQYSLQDVSQDNDGNLVGNNSSIALYSIQNVNASNLGSSAHVDINGALNPYPYPSNMVGYDNTYTKIEGYIPNPDVLNQSSSSNSFIAPDEQCKIACNNDLSCAGYVVYKEGTCNILTADQIFPMGGDRIPNSQYSTYIRNPKFPQNDKSCRNTLDAVIGTDAYSYYLNNGITPSTTNPMTPSSKCNLGKVLDNQMNELKIKNQHAVQKGEEVKGQFDKLFYRKNYVLNSISSNRSKAKAYDNKTKTTNDKIKDIENAQITKSAAEKDSELLLVSDNYKYVILGIVSLLLSIVTIKGLRIASS